MSLLSVGEMVIDFLPGDAPGVYIRKAGGAPANVAIAVSRQGQEAAFAGMLGHDDFGRFLLATLAENRVKALIPTLTDDAVTTLAFVTLSETGERSFTFARKPGADMLLRREDIRDDFFDGATIVHAGSCSLSKGSAPDATVYALRRARELHKLVSFDINYRHLLWDSRDDLAVQAVVSLLNGVDLLKLSEEELFFIGGRSALPGLARRFGIAATVLTMGEQGSVCYFQDEVLEIPAVPAVCVDATGAGDAFWGAFLADLMTEGVRDRQGLNTPLLRHALRRGSVAGSLCVRKKGAIESLPTLSEVLQGERECMA